MSYREGRLPYIQRRGRGAGMKTNELVYSIALLIYMLIVMWMMLR